MPTRSANDLYGLPLDQFIPERDRLVKALRLDGDRAQAAIVAEFKKPSIAAWAVNQLVRTQAKAVDVLFTAGDELANAQANALARKVEARALREATRGLKEALEQLLAAADGLLDSDGHPLSVATLERVSETLRAAALDQDARHNVKDGCLVSELSFAGLGLAAPSTDPLPPPRPTAAREAEAKRRQTAALIEARHVEAAARRVATRAEKELDAAKVRRDEAAAALEGTEQLVSIAERRWRDAAAELRVAEDAVSDLLG